MSRNRQAQYDELEATQGQLQSSLDELLAEQEAAREANRQALAQLQREAELEREDARETLSSLQARGREIEGRRRQNLASFFDNFATARDDAERDLRVIRERAPTSPDGPDDNRRRRARTDTTFVANAGAAPGAASGGGGLNHPKG